MRTPSACASRATSLAGGVTSMLTRFVSTAARSTRAPFDAGHRLGEDARVRVVLGRGARDGARARRAPPPRGCRSAACAPPQRLRIRRASATSLLGPQSALPTGAPRPFEKQTLAVSNGAQSAAAIDARRHARVPDARAVEVRGEAERARPLGHGPRGGRGPDAPAGAVVRVLDRHERRARRPVRARLHGRLESRPGRRCRRGPRRVNCTPLSAAAGAALVVDRVRPLADDHVVAGARLRGDGELVAHRPAGHEEGRLLARDARDLLARAR